MSEVRRLAGAQVVHDDDLVTPLQQHLADVGAQEPGPARHHGRRRLP